MVPNVCDIRDPLLLDARELCWAKVPGVLTGGAVVSAGSLKREGDIGGGSGVDGISRLLRERKKKREAVLQKRVNLKKRTGKEEETQLERK